MMIHMHVDLLVWLIMMSIVVLYLYILSFYGIEYVRMRFFNYIFFKICYIYFQDFGV